MSTRPRHLPRPDARPQLKVLPGGSAQRSAFIPAAIVLVLAVFAVTAVQAYVAQEGLRVTNLERQVREEEERYQLLRAQIAQRSSPERIRRVAEEAGMIPAPQRVYVPAPAPVHQPATRTEDPQAVKRHLAGVP